MTREISIHAPREGSDFGRLIWAGGEMTYFNPRTPRGERPGHHFYYR